MSTGQSLRLPARLDEMENKSRMLEDSSDEESQYDRSDSLDSGSKGHVVAGEAPESDVEEEFIDARQSTTPLHQKGDMTLKNTEAANMALTPAPPVCGSLLKSMDPFKYKKHVDLNKSLFKGLSENFLERLVVEETKKLEKLSQNLSTTQMHMQEALLQARIGSGNLLRLQMELSNVEVSGTHFRRLRPANP